MNILRLWFGIRNIQNFNWDSNLAIWCQSLPAVIHIKEIHKQHLIAANATSNRFSKF